MLYIWTYIIELGFFFFFFFFLSLEKQAILLLKNGSLIQLMDPRIIDTNDIKVVHHMTIVAFCCLKGVKGHRLSMSEVRLYMVDQELM
jgi:hypothetical protein